MTFIIKTAKTVEEAIEAGLKELNLSREEVEIDVLDEGKSGFLGLIGTKDAVVKIKEKDDISSFVRDILYDDDKSEELEEEPVQLEVEEKVEVKIPEEKPEEKIEIIEEPEIKKEEKPIIEELVEEFIEEEEEELSKEETRKLWSDIEIKNTTEELLGKIIDEMGIDYQIISEIDNNVLNVEIKSKNPQDLGIVIGKRGQTLNSLQFLLSLVVNKHREEFVRVNVDANNYRDKRKRSLENIARKNAQRAIKTGYAVRLDPMNARDRRIIHLVLQDYEEIETHSEGRDPYRRVVITKKK